MKALIAFAGLGPAVGFVLLLAEGAPGLVLGLAGVVAVVYAVFGVWAWREEAA